MVKGVDGMPVGGGRKRGRDGWGTGVEAVGKISTAGEGARKGFQGIEVCF